MVALARNSRSASWRVRSRIWLASSDAATAPIDSTSDSRKWACAESSSSAASWRRRSVTIRWNANAEAAAIAAARPPKASQTAWTARPSTARIAASATAPTSSPALVDDRFAKPKRCHPFSRIRRPHRQSRHGLQIGIASDASVDDRFAKRNRDRVRARVSFELREDVAHVALDRLLADEEAPGHICVGHSVREQLQDLALPSG